MNPKLRAALISLAAAAVLALGVFLKTLLDPAPAPFVPVVVQPEAPAPVVTPDPLPGVEAVSAPVPAEVL